MNPYATALRFEPEYLRPVHTADRAAILLVLGRYIGPREMRNAVRWALDHAPTPDAVRPRDEPEAHRYAEPNFVKAGRELAEEASSGLMEQAVEQFVHELAAMARNQE